MDRPRNIVTHKTEAGDSCIRLHDTTQGTLSVLGHGVGLIQYDYLIRWTRVGFPIRCNGLCPGCLPSEILDFFSDDANSALVGCIQFQNTGFKVVRTKQLPCEGKNGRGFSGPWGTVEKHVRKLSPEQLVHEFMWQEGGVYICGCQSLSQHGYGVFLSGDVVDGFWPAVKTGVSDEYALPQKDELFFDPRLSALIYRLLGTLLQMAKHLDRSRLGLW